MIELPRIVGADGIGYEEWSARREARTRSSMLTEADVRRIARDEAGQDGCMTLLLSAAITMVWLIVAMETILELL